MNAKLGLRVFLGLPFIFKSPVQQTHQKSTAPICLIHNKKCVSSVVIPEFVACFISNIGSIGRFASYI